MLSKAGLSPISTYSGEGTKGKGVDGKQHAIIYSNQPTIIEGEKENGLNKRAIRVIPDGPRGVLDTMSGLNYAELHKVQHHERVLFMGRLAKESEFDVAAESGVFGIPSSLGMPPPSSAASSNSDRDIHFLSNYCSQDQAAESIGSSLPSTLPYPMDIPKRGSAEFNGLVDAPFDVAKSLADLLCSDEDFRSLFREATSNDSPTDSMFVGIIQQITLKFSENLRAEGTTSGIIRAAGYIKDFSLVVALLSHDMLEPTQKLPAFLATRKAQIEYLEQKDRMFEIDLDTLESLSTPEFINTHESDDIGEIIKKTASWKLLLEDIKPLLNYIPVKRVLFSIWPFNIPRDTQHCISYVVRWEISRYISRNFPDDQSIRDILTLTADTSGTIAQSCREYLQSTFQEIGLYVLGAVEARLCNNSYNTGKSELIMVGLAGCLSLVMCDGGLAPNGLNSVLIPVEELLEDDAIQWHYCQKTAKCSKSRSSTFEIVEETGKWHKELNPGRLINRRCFLRWVPEASIVVGTKRYPGKEMNWSTAERIPDSRQIASYAFTMGTSGLDFATGKVSFSLTTSSMPSSIISKTEKDIHEILTDGENDTVLMYDSEKEIAWYLPQSCVVLFLVRARITNHHWEVFKGNKITHLELAEPGSGGSAANEALKANLNLHLKKQNSQPAEQYREETVGSLIKAIWQALDDIGMGLRSAQREFSKAKEGPPNENVEWKFYN
ncbi:predicted protein [Sclerotinia sclerotiorum 1980 UF-70]|uniref:DUF6590 domain-containing protein n=1 Tax=Sclerotinia sclerotiorum (strain ATCC 18683 / 1980 / Ss-1) TaxID=665079 RepID=A7EWD7_SCLS1|nr:predicted protein [Sclerotinia sclerotiorum 1980 UF-70]EDN93779.1 predicted protein [Sclerotinia sclerotiorum 1980 UF-70]